MYNRVLEYYRQNREFIWMLFCVFMIEVTYLSLVVVNVPIMDYWGYVSKFGEKYFNGSITIPELFIGSGGHIGILNQILLFINWTLFSWNTLFGIYGGTILISIILIVLYKHFKKSLKGRNDSYLYLYLIIILLFFSTNQWEILTLEFSLSFFLSRLLFLLIFLNVEKYLLNYSLPSKINFFEIGVAIILAILCISGGYFPAFVIGCFSMIVIDTIIIYYNSTRFNLKKYSPIILSLLFGSVIYLTIYFLHKSNPAGSGNFDLINAIRSLFIVSGSSVAHSLVITNNMMFANIIPFWSFYLIGGFVLLLYIYTVVIYFKEKYYNLSFIPFVFIIYSLSCMLLISVSRVSEFGIAVMASSRYVVDTTFGIVGITWILVIKLSNIKHGGTKSNYSSKIFLYSILFFLSLSILGAYLTEFTFAKFRKQYLINASNMMLHLDSFSDDQLNIFQANSSDQVRNGVKIMEKYKLGLFKYSNCSNEKSNVKDSLNKDYKCNYGCYEDGWVTKELSFSIGTKSKGIVSVKGYYPSKINGLQTIEIFVNGEFYEAYLVKEERFELLIDTKKAHETVNVRLVTNLEFAAKKPDIRTLSFLLIKVEGK